MGRLNPKGSVKKQRTLDKFLVAHIMKLFIIALLTLGLIGCADLADQQAQASEYCSMVKSGLWPDYLGTYGAECPRG